MAAAGRGHGCHQLCGGASACQPAAGGKRKIVLIAAIVLTAAALVYCKYTNFLLDTLNVIASTGFAKLSFLDVLPLGISYYTFKHHQLYCQM